MEWNPNTDYTKGKGDFPVIMFGCSIKQTERRIRNGALFHMKKVFE